MPPELWVRVKAVFDAACELSAPGRIAYLDSACAAEPQVRREVERLLAAHDSPVPLPDLSALKALDAVELPALSRGALGAREIIADRFEISRFIGAGGMGEVYEVLDRDFAAR